MKKIFIIALLFVTFKLSAVEIKPDAIYNSIRYEYILNSDGSIEFNYEHSLKYLTYFAINRLFGESFIVYNPDYQTLKITKSKTLTSEGKIINSPFNAFNEVLPSKASHLPGYFNLREMVVTHTGLERNCIVNFAYTLKTKAGFLPGLFGDIVIGSHSPIKLFEIIIKVPKGKKLNLFMSNNGPMGEKFQEGNFDVYHWKLENLPIIPVESNQAHFKEFLPTLYFSTISPKNIVENLLKKELYVLDEKTKKKIDELLKDKFTYYEKIKTLQNYVYRNITGSNLNFNLIGLKPQSAQLTFNRGSGSYLDKAILLKAMCNAAGFESDLALSTNYQTEKPDLTLLSEFGVFAVNCKSDENDDVFVLLDPNIKQKSLVPMSIYNKTVFTISKEKVYLISPFNSENKSVFKANVDYTNLQMKANYSASGKYIEDFDVNSFDKKLNRHLNSRGFKTKEKSKEGAIIFNQFEKSLNFKIKKQNITDEIEKLIFPSLPKTFDEMYIKLVPASRITPFKLDKLYNELYQVTIDLKDEQKKLLNPIEIKETNSIGEVKISIKQNGNKIEFSRQLKLNKQFIEPKDYHLLYKLISYWDNDKYHFVYLK